MLTQTIAILDFENALIIQDLEARTTLLKMCISLITSLIKSEIIERLVFSNVYRRPKIFKYDLDLERQGLSM